MKIVSDFILVLPNKDIDISVGYSAGFIFDGNRHLTSQELQAFFQEASDWDDFLSRAKRITGEWAVVFQRAEGEVWAATDHRSSQRLYFRLAADGLRMAENGYSLFTERDSWDGDAVLFFLRWGYTPADSTLIREIRRLPPGHALRYRVGEGITTTAYDTVDRYAPFDSHLLSYEEAKEELKHRLILAGKRLVRYLNGRPAILPLSGGFDSRMIAYMLHRLKYPHVYCISYGKEGNPDSLKAAKVADKLGFPFVYINSVRPDRPDYTQDAEFLSYMYNMTGLSSCYYYQEFIAAASIASGSVHNGMVSFPSNAVVLPGHQGDDLGGSQLMYSRLAESKLSPNKLSHILYSHKQMNQQFDRKQKERLLSIQAKLFSSYDKEQQPAYRTFEQYMQWENIPKYMLNSQQSWRFFGLDTVCMLLDKELLDFAYSLPFEYRYGKRIYDDICRELYGEKGISFSDDLNLHGIISSPVYRLKRSLKPLLRPFIPRPSIWKGDIIGFERIMQPVLRQVEQDGRFHPTSINGLSFCWYLLQNEKLIDRPLPL